MVLSLRFRERMADLNRHGYMLNKPATVAALALEESMYSCVADLTPFWAVPVTCDCNGCWRMELDGRELPGDGTCQSSKEHDEIRYNRDLRWELVAILEEEEAYAYYRCYERYQDWDDQEARYEAQDQKRDFLEGKLAA
jgi:hypothetical protein